MGAKVKLKMKRGAMYDLRRAPGVRGDLARRGHAVLEAAGGIEAGYGISASQGKKHPQGRWRVGIFTKTFDAIRDNAKNHTLLRALDKGR